MQITKIKYHRVYEDVIVQIENMILEGDFSIGDVLPTEREFAQLFGISRGTLREAFRILEEGTEKLPFLILNCFLKKVGNFLFDFEQEVAYIFVLFILFLLAV